MHTFFSHIRGRIISHPAAAHSHQETSSVIPPTPVPGCGVDPIVETSPAARHSLGNRILENPSSYLDTDDSTFLAHSLSPSTRRHSSVVLHNIQRAGPISGGVFEVDEPHEPLEPPEPSQFDRPLQLAATEGWSTFGRRRGHKRARSYPTVPEFPDHSPTKDTSRQISYPLSPKRNNSSKNCKEPSSTGSSHSITTFGNVSHSSLTPHEIPTQASDNGHTLTNNVTSYPSINSKSSPTDTESSRRYPRTPNRQRFNTSPTTRPTAHLTTPILRELGFDSPGTFGHPTPESRTTFTFTKPSPPPLPPLNHPALSSRLEDKSATNTIPGISKQSNTFPERTSGIPSGIGDGFFASLSMSFGRSFRHSASLPKVQHAFPSSLEEQPAQRPRARTISDNTRHHRRNSASWSAQQATEGVNSSSNTAWPAEVSREILRLSLGEGLDLVDWPSTGVPGPGSQTLVATRGRVAQFPNQAPISRSSFSSPSSPSPRRRHSPIPQGGDRIPQPLQPPLFRPTSYINSRMSSKLNVAHVAQDGATSPDHIFSRLDVPVGPSGTQGRHGVSSQFLLPPSAIKTTPARISRSNTMDPTTPTPASRNLSDMSKGKRKAEDIETTPPEQKKDVQRTTFAVPESNRSQKISGSSHAPSSYHRKRARLSSSSPFATPVQSRPASVQDQTPEVGKFSSWSSQTSARILSTPRAPSRATSNRSIHQTPHKKPQTPASSYQNHARHQSMSQVSIPISALVSPHAPSIVPSGKFHMRDPRRPPKKLAETPWTLHFSTEEEPGSPVHAWCFFLGFILFPVWWIAALFLRTPGTRVVGDEKGISLDDPQIEHDAKAWRFRCRIMSVVSLFTYIPFIIVVVILTRR